VKPVLQSVLSRVPGAIGIVGSDLRCEGRRVVTEILLIYDTVLVDDESHDAA